MDTQGALDKLGFSLCIGTFVFCAILHVGTFVAIVSLFWIIPASFLLAGAVLCSSVLNPRPRFALHFDKLSMLGWVLLIYALCTFAYDYKTTGGATSVGIVNGQYVSMYKDRVIRVITDSEYKMFPDLWTRVMSAWIAMMAVFCATSFRWPLEYRSEQR
jgi:hypothetical protein